MSRKHSEFDKCQYCGHLRKNHLDIPYEARCGHAQCKCLNFVAVNPTELQGNFEMTNHVCECNHSIGEHTNDVGHVVFCRQCGCNSFKMRNGQMKEVADHCAECDHYRYEHTDQGAHSLCLRLGCDCTEFKEKKEIAVEKTEFVIVTRHEGAVKWLEINDIRGTVIDHVKDPAQIAGKIVVGALPLHLAALCKMVISIDIPDATAEQRGKDLTAKEMSCLGAHLKTYIVRETSENFTIMPIVPAEIGWIKFVNDQVWGYLNGRRGEQWYYLGNMESAVVNMSGYHEGIVSEFKAGDLYADPKTGTIVLNSY